MAKGYLQKHGVSGGKSDKNATGYCYIYEGAGVDKGLANIYKEHFPELMEEDEEDKNEIKFIKISTDVSKGDSVETNHRYVFKTRPIEKIDEINADTSFMNTTI